jgi:hypothetical protein
VLQVGLSGQERAQFPTLFARLLKKGSNTLRSTFHVAHVRAVGFKYPVVVVRQAVLPFRHHEPIVPDEDSTQERRPSPGLRVIGRFWRFPGPWLRWNGVWWCTRWRGRRSKFRRFSRKLVPSSVQPVLAHL